MRLIDVTLTIEVEDDADWDEEAREIVDAVSVVVRGWSVGDEYTQL